MTTQTLHGLEESIVGISECMCKSLDDFHKHRQLFEDPLRRMGESVNYATVLDDYAEVVKIAERMRQSLENYHNYRKILDVLLRKI